MKPTQQLVDDLFWEKVRAAKAMSDEDRFFAGARLFEQVCRVMSDGIRSEHPLADDTEVLRILRDRLELARKLEQR